MATLSLPEIPESERTPLVDLLLAIIQQQDQRIRQLEDEVARLKGLTPRPQIRPSILERPDPFGDSPPPRPRKRPGSAKRSKAATLEIHQTQVLRPEPIPDGSRLLGYDDFVVQDLVVGSRNTLYRRERWRTPDGGTVVAALPESLRGRHFGPVLTAFILYQYHHQHVTQPLIREALREWGVDISAGQVNRIITEGHDALHAEARDVLRTGLELSGVLHVDDTQARHRGRNGFCTHVGGELFSWFASTDSKSRINVLGLLRAGHDDYLLDAVAWGYLTASNEAGGIPPRALGRLEPLRGQRFEGAAAFEAALRRAGVGAKHHIKIATEAALLGSAVDHGLSPAVVLVSDEAPQYRLLTHALCWIHAERPFARLVGRDEAHRGAIESVRHRIWELYQGLKRYREAPSPAGAEALRGQFRALVRGPTGYADLDRELAGLGREETDLLRVLERPEAPLHNNAAERAIRDYAKKRKISGSTRSDLGRRCRDTFATLKGTCRKLGQSFWGLLRDRVSGSGTVPALPALMRRKATAPG